MIDDLMVDGVPCAGEVGAGRRERDRPRPNPSGVAR